MSSQIPVASGTVSFERERGVYGVEFTPGLAHVEVKVGSDSERIPRITLILQTLADQRVPIFLTKFHSDSITFGLEDQKLYDVQRCLNDEAIKYSARKNLALLSIKATSIRDVTGVMVSVADSLQRARARLIAVGDSHSSIQCPIEGDRMNAAIAELRAAFRLEP